MIYRRCFILSLFVHVVASFFALFCLCNEVLHRHWEVVSKSVVHVMGQGAAETQNLPADLAQCFLQSRALVLQHLHLFQGTGDLVLLPAQKPQLPQRFV